MQYILTKAAYNVYHMELTIFYVVLLDGCLRKPQRLRQTTSKPWQGVISPCALSE